MKKEKKEKRPPVAIDPLRLTKGAARLLSSIGARTLHKEFTDDERAAGGVYFFMEPGGKKANKEASEELIRKGHLKPCADSLFGDDAQSYTL